MVIECSDAYLDLVVELLEPGPIPRLEKVDNLSPNWMAERGVEFRDWGILAQGYALAPVS
ncbi:hypothetical protein AUG19_04010 [archaeon 13_1_20CM_2_54_9]|nr:MAG: hypothetical protein AUJ07_06620 [Crenarchaeota archaeon 13_1_40CM_3_53_5]OLE75984.1 MAG: hypothetical protein AUG19_04010 [archaeon 13_1_20CM_2_54_9]